jgi:hypothetical protein
MALYPAPRRGAVNSALKVAISHLKELMAPENARNGDFVAGKHRENLSSGVFVIRR